MRVLFTCFWEWIQNFCRCWWYLDYR